MTDLHEIAMEQMGWTPQQAAAILEVYERDKKGAIPTVPQCYIDATAVVHPTAKVWHFARVLQQVVIGEHCSIGGGTEIGRASVVGARSRIGANVFLPPNSTIGSDVFVGPGVVCTDDMHPLCGNSEYVAQPPTIKDGASIGAGVILLPGVTIGMNARIAAGAVVTEDVPDDVCVMGAPARVRPMPIRWRRAG